MNRIEGKQVLITGASAGIGAACARAFAARGADLILIARRLDRLDELKRELEAAHSVTVRRDSLDVRDRESVETCICDLAAAGVVPDVLVNNAGLARGLSNLHDGNPDDWDEMIDTNIKGLLYMARAVLPLMVQRNSGHVVNIGSIAGYTVYPKGNVYNATKFAVRALNEGMSIDLVGTNVRVSSVDPGLVKTDFSEVRFRGDTERADAVYEGLRTLLPEDIADAVAYVVNAPEHVNVRQMIVMATDQRNPYVMHRPGS